MQATCPQAPLSDSRLDVLEACAVYSPPRSLRDRTSGSQECVAQATHVECLQAIYISLEQGPGFRTVQAVLFLGF